MAADTTSDGFRVETVVLDPALSRWDFRVTVTHPCSSLRWEAFASGGASTRDTVRARLLSEARAVVLAGVECGCPPRVHCDAPERHPACRTCDDCASPHPATCITSEAQR